MQRPGPVIWLGARMRRGALVLAAALCLSPAAGAQETAPPATITSQLGLATRMLATFMLLVITVMLRWFSNSRATASVEVPRLMMIEQFSGIAAAQARAMADFAASFSLRRSS